MKLYQRREGIPAICDICGGNDRDDPSMELLQVDAIGLNGVATICAFCIEVMHQAIVPEEAPE